MTALKKFFAILISAALLLFLTGCANEPQEPEIPENEPISEESSEPEVSEEPEDIPEEPSEPESSESSSSEESVQQGIEEKPGIRDLTPENVG